MNQRWIALSLSFALGLAALPTIAAPPGADEKARAAVAAGRALIREAVKLEAQSDEKDKAADKLQAEADALDAAAAAKRAQAAQKFREAGAYARREMAADAMRSRARAYLSRAAKLEPQARALTQAGNAELARAKSQRDSAATLLTGSPDAEMKKDAAELTAQAAVDEKQGQDLLAQAAKIRAEIQHLRTEAAQLLARANKLDPDGM